MNIQFDNERLFTVLADATVECFTFGSHLFGLNTKDSDQDQIAIYARGTNEDRSFMWSHHCLQYIGSTNGEIIFTSLQNFVRNLLTGDSTFFFEVIHDYEQMKNSGMEYLYMNRHLFYNYSIIKGYIGIAKRDLKYSMKNAKRFSHAYRSIRTAERIYYDGYYTNTFSNNDFDMMKKLKDNGFDKKEKQSVLQDLQNREKELRSLINEDLNHNQISRYMDKDSLKDLDHWVQQYCSKAEYKHKQGYVDLDLLYEALENGIEY